MKIAVLLTCFNRRDKTKSCLENLYSQQLPAGFDLQVFLCDDGSTDGTDKMLKEFFPQVHVTKGNGHLYWGGGMRAAWRAAKKIGGFEVYLWLNDDTDLFSGALISLWNDYQSLGCEAIITAACIDPDTREFSYGGLEESEAVLPNGKPRRIKYMNGNLVWIPASVEEKIGGISPVYTHYLGDYDFGLRAQKAGIPCYTSSKYLASCSFNSVDYWADPRLSFFKRWNLIHDVKGLAIKEYIFYKAYHHGKWIAFKTWCEVYLKAISPMLYSKLRKVAKLC